MSSEFLRLLEKMRAIHEKKNKDYSTAENPFKNFEETAQLISWFNDPIDKTFASLVGVKLSRIATLSNNKQKPNNESVADSFLDLCTYCALWASYRERATEIDPLAAEFKYQCKFCAKEVVGVPLMYEFNGKTYYFDTEQCRRNFGQAIAETNQRSSKL